MRIKFLASTLFCLLIVSMSVAEVSWDGERLNLEVRMQQRVEEALSKIIPPGQFVVVVRVEPWPASIDNQGNNLQSSEDEFVLPGVPTKNRLDRNDAKVNALIDSLKTDKTYFHRFIRRISATLVIDKDLSNEVVTKSRDLTRQILGLDSARGDILDIQRSAFNKPMAEIPDNSGLTRVQKNIQKYSLLIVLSVAVFCIIVFLLFIFGPLRGFLNNFVSTLGTMKPLDPEARMSRQGDSQLLSQIMAAQAMGLLPGSGSIGLPMGSSPASFSGSLQVENPNKRTTPFGFIREDHLGNLATLLSRETPERAAIVLGYLPPDWISRVLSKMDVGLQSEVTDQLATTRQLLPEQVEDIEQELKRRLDYLIGGPDRIIAVYESLDAESQRRMLETLKNTRPDIAEELRHRTMLFEDIDRLEPHHLKSLLREVDLQTLVLSLRGSSPEFRQRIMENMSEGKAQIIKEELELNDTKAGKATLEAQRKIALIARRLEREGQIQIPEIDPGLPAPRYGANSLLSSIKLPPGLKLESPSSLASEETEIIDPKSTNFQERIKRFMGKTLTDKKRFPADQDINNEETLPPSEG